MTSNRDNNDQAINSPSDNTASENSEGNLPIIPEEAYRKDKKKKRKKKNGYKTAWSLTFSGKS
jgi:hypothetical protein